MNIVAFIGQVGIRRRLKIRSTDDDAFSSLFPVRRDPPHLGTNFGMKLGHEEAPRGDYEAIDELAEEETSHLCLNIPSRCLCELVRGNGEHQLEVILGTGAPTGFSSLRE